MKRVIWVLLIGVAPERSQVTLLGFALCRGFRGRWCRSWGCGEGCGGPGASRRSIRLQSCCRPLPPPRELSQSCRALARCASCHGNNLISLTIRLEGGGKLRLSLLPALAELKVTPFPSKLWDLEDVAVIPPCAELPSPRLAQEGLHAQERVTAKSDEAMRCSRGILHQTQQITLSPSCLFQTGSCSKAPALPCLLL